MAIVVPAYCMDPDVKYCCVEHQRLTRMAVNFHLLMSCQILSIAALFSLIVPALAFYLTSSVLCVTTFCLRENHKVGVPLIMIGSPYVDRLWAPSFP